MTDTAVIILTYNEELHIARCIESVRGFAREIFVVDSFSTDRTVEIARGLGAQVFQNKWEDNHAKQFNWGLDNLPITTGWIMRLDADEVVPPELASELEVLLPQLGDDVNGVEIERYQTCFGKPMHYIMLLRLFRRGTGRCEQRWMDEHITLSGGRTVRAKNRFVDDNLNTFGWWIAKHNSYATREAIELLDAELGILSKESAEANIGGQASVKRGMKYRYARLPLFWRSGAYFFYRYILKGGFLRGRERFIWDFFQGWWYRSLVDARILEIKRACGEDREKILDFIRDRYGIDVRKN